MVKRRNSAAVGEGGLYFSSENSRLKFVQTGCSLLDEVLGGGWVLGRVANVVGDKAVGKTLLAIEAAANFHMAYPKGRIYYAEAESAFDVEYAQCVGLPKTKVRFREGIDTVEDWYEDLVKVIDRLKGRPGMYILDSLDALSDRAEMARDISEGTYGANKPKQMSQLFRRLTRKIARANLLVMVISQTRDRIDPRAFGRKYSRSGGKALDFYASQVLYLGYLHMNKKTIQGVNRTIGIHIGARTDKNKVGWPYRDCEFDIRFGYGIDDIQASVDWLREVKRLDAIGLNKKEMRNKKLQRRYVNRIHKLPRSEFNDEQKRLSAAVHQVWKEIEMKFRPPRSKYGDD